MRHRRRLRTWSDEFAARLDSPDAAPVTRLGLEHEFRVVDADDGIVDARSVLPTLGLGVADLDPADPLACRLPSGAVVTCDDAEAELAIPPVPLGPGFAGLLDAHAARTRAELLAAMPRRFSLEGYSTHLSVSVPSALVATVACRYARSWTPALMLLLDPVDAPGLLVRPRPGRLELGGDFASGAALRAAAAFVAGSVELESAAAASGAPGPLAPLDGTITAVRRRAGWFVDRAAFGDDLYVHGRAAALPLTRGGRTSAQARLEAAWGLARSALERRVAAADLSDADALVAGVAPLPCEHRRGPGRTGVSGTPEALDVPNAFGEVLEPFHGRGFDLAAVMVTWSVVVFVAADERRTRRAFVCVPGDALRAFRQRLAAGDLDHVVVGYLSELPAHRVLAHARDATRPGLWDELGARAALLPAEPVMVDVGAVRRAA
jgi:hypothetical protein